MGKWGAVQGSVCGGERREGESVPLAGIGCRRGFEGRCGGGARDGGSSLRPGGLVPVPAVCPPPTHGRHWARGSDPAL